MTLADFLPAIASQQEHGMAHIELTNNRDGSFTIMVNGVDLSAEVFRESVELVSVGDDPRYAEVGLRLTLAFGGLSLDGSEVKVTDRLDEASREGWSFLSEDAPDPVGVDTATGRGISGGLDPGETA